VAFLTLLTSPLGKLGLYAALALVVLGAGLGVKHEWDLGQTARVEVKHIAAVSKTQTKAVAVVDAHAAKHAAAAQIQIVTRTRTLLKEVPTYVTVRSPCIPWGALRLHDAAVLGVDASTLQPPAGQSDDACSDVAPAAFVAGVVANYGAARQNAQQLNDLEADIVGRAAAVLK
jgi:hypothetical protein